jgi:hypothetical protein
MFVRPLAPTAVIVTGAQPAGPTFEVAPVRQNVSSESMVTVDVLVIDRAEHRVED